MTTVNFCFVGFFVDVFVCCMPFGELAGFSGHFAGWQSTYGTVLMALVSAWRQPITSWHRFNRFCIDLSKLLFWRIFFVQLFSAGSVNYGQFMTVVFLLYMLIYLCFSFCFQRHAFVSFVCLVFVSFSIFFIFYFFFSFGDWCLIDSLLVFVYFWSFIYGCLDSIR